MKKVLLEKVGRFDLLVLEINQNLMARTDQINRQEMERKKVLVLKENQVLQKKITKNHLALQTIQNILAENHQKIHLQIQRKEKMVLRERKNLRVEIADQKTIV